MKTIRYIVLLCSLGVLTQVTAQTDSVAFRQLELNAGPNYVLNILKDYHQQHQHFPGLELALDYKQRDKNAVIFTAEVYWRVNNGDPDRMLKTSPGNDSAAVLGNYWSLGVNAGAECRAILDDNTFFFGLAAGVSAINLPEEIYFVFNEDFGPPSIAQGYAQIVPGLNGKAYAGFESQLTDKMVFGLKVNARLELPLQDRTTRIYTESVSFETDVTNEMILSFYPQLYYAFRF